MLTTNEGTIRTEYAQIVYEYHEISAEQFNVYMYSAYQELCELTFARFYIFKIFHQSEQSEYNKLIILKTKYHLPSV